MCSCGKTITTNTICTTCAPTDCACPIKDFSTDCIQYTGEDLPCTEIKKGTLMTELIGQLDTYLCDLSDQLANSFSLVTVGAGTRVYKGVDGIGRKEIRSISSIDTILTIGISTDDKEIQIGLDDTGLKSFVQGNQITYSATNVGTGAGVYKQSVRTGDNINLSFKKIRSSQSAISIVEGTDDINITIDGSETKLTAGTAISISGTGTTTTPYIITNDLPDRVVSIANGTAISVTGTYPNFTVTNTLPDRVVSIAGQGATTVTGTYPNFTVSSTDTSTSYSAGAGLSLSGTTFSIANLQKPIAGSYTITDADDNYEIIIANGATAATITIPAGLKAKISVGFIQQGTADVTFVGPAVTINSPLSMKKIKGQNYNAYITQVEGSNVYQLVGNLKLV